MGAIPYANADGSPGTTFRVWAPFAQSVAVAGSFNGWAAAANPLAPEAATGYWSGDIDGVGLTDRYKFVIGTPAGPLWKVDPYAKQVESSAGNGIVMPPGLAWGNDGFAMPNWNQLVIYEIHVGTFNDTVVGSPGTLDSAIAYLPYLKDLGVNAVEIMPIHEFAGDFNEGYDPIELSAVESAYGGSDALVRFVQAAHQNNLAVIVDVVYNHFSSSNDLGYCEWQFDGWQQNGMGGIYMYQDWRAWTPWGSANRPDYGRPEVRQFLHDNALFWLQQYQMDGLRVDSVSFMRNVYGNDNDPAHDLSDAWALLQWINNDIAGSQPWKVTIAEDLHGNPWITNSTGAGGAGFGSQWDDSFCNTIRNAVIGPNDDARDVGSVAAAITSTIGSGSTARVVYTESHDDADQGRNRVPEAIWPGNSGSWASKKRSTLAASIVMTSPGIPMILQGQEFLEYGYFADDISVNWPLLGQYGGIRDLYQTLIRLRRNWNNNTRGLAGPSVNVYQAGPDDKVVAFHRWDQGGPGDDVIVVANFRNVGYTSYAIGFPRPGTWYVRFNSDYNGYSPSDFSGWLSYDTTAGGPGIQNMPYSGNIGIGPYTCIILSQ